ncbi:MAG: hypothetical protein ACI809_002713, partial [Candidatus Azotimanducaceae bacterium]
ALNSSTYKTRAVRLIFDTNASEVSISALATNLVTLPAQKKL